MYVQIILKPPICVGQAAGRIGASVETAIEEGLPDRPSRFFVHVMTADGDAGSGPQSGPPSSSCVAVVIHSGRRYSDRAKRGLFGRILDRLEQDLHISRTLVLITLVELPAVNWSAGYSQDQWLQALSYQLP